MKINVIGTSGRGKSTLARQLAIALGIPYLEMDQLFWKPNWQESTDEEFFPRLEEALAAEAWVLDGNYTRTTALKWRRADLVVWVDFSFPRTLYRALKRALIRAITKIELWPDTGNHESLARLFSKESMVLYTAKTYWGNRQKYEALMQAEEYAHLTFVRVQTPKQASSLIQSLTHQNIT